MKNKKFYSVILDEDELRLFTRIFSEEEEEDDDEYVKYLKKKKKGIHPVLSIIPGAISGATLGSLYGEVADKAILKLKDTDPSVFVRPARTIGAIGGGYGLYKLNKNQQNKIQNKIDTYKRSSEEKRDRMRRSDSKFNKFNKK